jgi:hypothetical protein
MAAQGTGQTFGQGEEPLGERLEPRAEQELVPALAEHPTVGVRQERGPPLLLRQPDRPVVGRVHEQHGEGVRDRADGLQRRRQVGIPDGRGERPPPAVEPLATEVHDERRRVAPRDAERHAEQRPRRLRRPDGYSETRPRPSARPLGRAVAARERRRRERERGDLLEVLRRPERREDRAERMTDEHDGAVSRRAPDHGVEVVEVERPVVLDLRLVRTPEPGEVRRGHGEPMTDPAREPVPVPPRAAEPVHREQRGTLAAAPDAHPAPRQPEPSAPQPGLTSRHPRSVEHAPGWDRPGSER